MIDVFTGIEGQPAIIRCNTSTESEKVIKPPFVKIARDVTHEKEY